MQVLDQKIALPRARAEQRAYLCKRSRIDLAAFGGTAGPPAGAGRLANYATI